MKISEIVRELPDTRNTTSEDIKQRLRRLEDSIVVSDYENQAIKNTLLLIDQQFNGDAIAAIEFLKSHGNDPEIANKDYNEFIQSGGASTYIQRKRDVAQAPTPPVRKDGPKPKPDNTYDDRPKRIVRQQSGPSDTMGRNPSAINDDGSVKGITKEQFLERMDKTLKQHHDQDGDGFLVNKEYHGLVLNQLGSKAFDRLDENGDGKVSMDVVSDFIKDFKEQPYSVASNAAYSQDGFKPSNASPSAAHDANTSGIDLNSMP